MKILLVYPQAKIWNMPKQIPLGLATIGAVLLKAGHEVKVFDAAIEKRNLKSIFQKNKFDLIGLSATTPLIKNAWELATVIKKISKAPIVIGGPHVSALSDESLEQKGIDFVVRGEGEETILEICEMILGKRKKEQILGLSYKNKGKIVHNPARPLIKNLDDLPFPAYHLFKVEKYSITQPLRDRQTDKARAFYIMTSRGCPYGCVYCYKGICGRSWRPKTAERVVEEWEYLVRDLRATEIGVQDDVFNLNRVRAMKICDLLIKKGLNNVPWITNNGIRADKVDLELLKKMKEAGCKRVAFGVESGSQKILDKIKKQLTLSQIEKAFKLAKKVDLEIMGFFMFGNLDENDKTMEQTIKFAIKLNPDIAHFSIATPFPGAPLYEEILKNGQLLNTDWNDFGILEGKGMFKLGEVTPKLVSQKWHESYRKFYLRPSRLFQEIKRFDNWLNFKLLFNAGKRYFLPSFKV
jgi:anaerobic magnesium-protoporphyrin IX monomethyl ester cyclase